MRNRFRQARYDKLKAALIVQRAKQPPPVMYDSDSDDSMPDLETSGSESGMRPGESDDDPEFSDSDSSSDEAEIAPIRRVPPGADSTVQKGGTLNIPSTPNTSSAQSPSGTQTIQAPPRAVPTVPKGDAASSDQKGAISSPVEGTKKEQEPATVLAVENSADPTVEVDPSSPTFLADVAQVFQVSHAPQVANFL